MPMAPFDLQKAGFKTVTLQWFIPLMLFLPLYQDSIAKKPAIESPSDKSAYWEEQIHFTNGQAVLAGTLFRPASGTDYPAVVILAGSDRSKRGPLRINLARHFAVHKMAALVYDSPGTGSSTGSAVVQTSADRVDEALSAVDYLGKLQGIRSTSVGLFGGSEGANIALLASAKSARVEFVIAVSGALGVPILDVLRYSAEKKGYMLGLTHDEIMKAITFKEIAFVFFSGVDLVEWPLIESRVKTWQDDTWTTLINISKHQKNNLTGQEKSNVLTSLRQVVKHFKSRRWFDAADPGDSARRIINLDANQLFKLLAAGRYTRDWDRSMCNLSTIRCPVLAIWGEEDSFLPPQQSALRLKKALYESGHADYEIKIFPKATHFLTGPGSADDFIPGYIDTMAAWLGRHTGSNK